MLLVARGNTCRSARPCSLARARSRCTSRAACSELGCRTRAQAVRKLTELGTLPPEDSARTRPQPAASSSLPRTGLAADPSVLSSTTVPPESRASAARRCCAPSPVSAARTPASAASAAGTGSYPVTRQVAELPPRPRSWPRRPRRQAPATQVGPGQPGGVPQSSPDMMVSPVATVPSSPRTRLARDARRAGLDRQQGWRTGAWPAPVVDHGGLGERPDSCRDRDQGRASRPCRPAATSCSSTSANRVE